MSVWVCVPSKRPPEEVRRWALAWKAMGYSITLWRDPGESEGVASHVDMVIVDPYPGYAVATNKLIHYAIGKGATWCVIGGDDVFPDPTNLASSIASITGSWFRSLHSNRASLQSSHYSGDELDALATFGVMQPTGDEWASTPRLGRDIERICGSAWIGREFALRAYGGRGPLYQGGEPCWNRAADKDGDDCIICEGTGEAIGYKHMFPDEELQNVAIKLGCFQQRRDLTQRHEHWCRGENRTRDEHMPAFLAEANSKEHWAKYKAILETRKVAGFPGCEAK